MNEKIYYSRYLVQQFSPREIQWWWWWWKKKKRQQEVKLLGLPLLPITRLKRGNAKSPLSTQLTETFYFYFHQQQLGVVVVRSAARVLVLRLLLFVGSCCTMDNNERRVLDTFIGRQERTDILFYPRVLTLCGCSSGKFILNSSSSFVRILLLSFVAASFQIFSRTSGQQSTLEDSKTRRSSFDARIFFFHYLFVKKKFGSESQQVVDRNFTSCFIYLHKHFRLLQYRKFCFYIMTDFLITKFFTNKRQRLAKRFEIQRALN